MYGYEMNSSHHAMTVR